MRPHSDRSNPRSATTVGNAKRLVQIQMRDVPAELTRLRYTHQCIQICAINVNLTSRRVNLFTYRSYARFKYPVC